MTDRTQIEIPGQIELDDPLGGDAGRWRRRKLADALDSTRTWVDPNGYRLADRLWLAKAADREQIDKLLRGGIIAGDSAVDIARRLESLLTPEARILRNPLTGRVLPKEKQPKGTATRTPYGSTGSYAARRLARTELTRAWGVGVIEAAKKNPFVNFIRWVVSGSHPEPDHCDDNANADPSGVGIPGAYLVSQVPRYPQHPHCLCHLTPIVPPITDDVVDGLRAQYGLGENTAATGLVPSKAKLIEEKVAALKAAKAAKKAAEEAAAKAAQIAAAEAKAAEEALAKLLAEKAAKEAAEHAAKLAAEKAAKEAAHQAAVEAIQKQAAESAAKKAAEKAAVEKAAKEQAARDLKNARLRAARAAKRAQANATEKAVESAAAQAPGADPLLAATAKDRALAIVQAAEDAGRMPAAAAKAMTKEILAGKLDEEALRDLYNSLGKQLKKADHVARMLTIAEREGVITAAEAKPIRDAAAILGRYTGAELDEHANELMRRSRLHRLSRFKDLEAFDKRYDESKFTSAARADYDKWRAQSTKEQGKALDAYKNGDFTTINKHLRKGATASASDTENIRLIDEALDGAHLSQDGKLMRGTTWRAGKPPDEWANARPGDILSDKGYVSTTFDSDVAKGFGGAHFRRHAHTSLFDFYAPKGTNALFIDPRLKGSLKESEILLARNTRFLVREVKKHADGAHDFVLEILP